MVAIASFKRETILRAVRDMYTEVARAPNQGFHFPVGHAACRYVGYPETLLAQVPPTALESFAGVGYPFAANVIRAGDVVLDIGSGSGTDALIAARLAGPQGKVYALDMTEAMRAKLQANLERAGVSNVTILPGEMETIPLPDASVDVVTSNGVLNLAPDKEKAIAEAFRVLKPGGRLQLADIALAKPISNKYKQNPELWAECIVGAVEEDKYLEMFRAAGFRAVEAIGHLDYFSAAPGEDTRTVAKLFGAHTVVLRALKPAAEELAVKRDSALTRAWKNFAKECAGVAGAAMAAAICAGVAPLVAALGAVGAGAFARHAYMFPVFTGFIAWNVWLLWRSGRARSHLGPFWLALASGTVAIAAFWLAVVGLVPAVWWWPYAGLGLLVAASLWVFSRRAGMRAAWTTWCAKRRCVTPKRHCHSAWRRARRSPPLPPPPSTACTNPWMPSYPRPKGPRSPATASTPARARRSAPPPSTPARDSTAARAKASSTPHPKTAQTRAACRSRARRPIRRARRKTIRPRAGTLFCHGAS